MNNSKNYTSQSSVDMAFLDAWQQNDKEQMKQLVSNPNLSFHFKMNYSHPQAHKHTGANFFMEICATGDIEWVQFLLTSPDIKHKVNINSGGFYDSPLSYAVTSGNFELVKYMLTQNAQIMPEHFQHTQNEGQSVLVVKLENWPLERAIEKRNFEMIDYFLASTELKEHAKLTKDIMEEYADDEELMNFIRKKGYVVEQDETSDFKKDKNGQFVTYKF